MLLKIQVGFFKGSSHTLEGLGVKEQHQQLHGPDGGFGYLFIFTRILGEDSHFDYYFYIFQRGLVQPPTDSATSWGFLSVFLR